MTEAEKGAKKRSTELFFSFCRAASHTKNLDQENRVWEMIRYPFMQTRNPPKSRISVKTNIKISHHRHYV